MAERAKAPPVPPSSTRNTNPSSPSAQHKRLPRKSKQHAQFSLDGSVSDTSIPINANFQQPSHAQRQRQGNNMSGISAQQGGSPARAMDKHSQASTHQDLLEATPSKERAYAGPTFQTSPAPSSLPLPKFFARSMSLQGKLAGDGTFEGRESSPEPDIVSSQIPARDTQKSPLDMFFAADRAEREQTRRASSNLSPEAAFRRPQQPPPSAGRSAPPPDNHSLDQMEGVPLQSHGIMLGDRLPQASEDDRQAYTKSLKDLLFNNSASPMSTPPHTRSGANSGSQTPDSTYYTPRPFYGGAPGAAPYPGPHETQNHYSLHYGNRNLSSLFKDARADTPPRPSSLRQEVGNDIGTAGHSNSNVYARANWSAALENAAVNTANRQYNPTSQNPTFSGFRSDPALGHVPNSRSQTTFVPQDVPEGETSTANSRSDTNRDLRGMEDDLRRMLKLNV